MPQVASGVRNGLRLVSGKMLAPAKNAATVKPRRGRMPIDGARMIVTTNALTASSAGSFS